MKKVLITGAAGFIGRHLARELAGRGYDLVLTDLPGADLAFGANYAAECVSGDLLDPGFARQIMSGADGAVHLAAAFDLGLPREYLVPTNVRTTVNTVRAAAEAGAGMFVQYSTCDVFGLKRMGPVREDDSKRPQCAYSSSKLISEVACGIEAARGDIHFAVVRPTFVYGPGAIYTARSFLLLPALAARYTDSIPLPAGGPRTNTIHVEDLVSATAFVLEAGEKASGLAFDVADDSNMCARDFLEAIFEPFGIECDRTLPVPWAVMEGMGRLGELLPHSAFAAVDRFLQKRWDRVVRESELDPVLSVKLDRDFLGFLYGEHLYANDRIKSLGWEPRYPTFRDGWPSTVKWYRENNLVPEY